MGGRYMDFKVRDNIADDIVYLLRLSTSVAMVERREVINP